jgi:hypothetical protein
MNENLRSPPAKISTAIPVLIPAKNVAANCGPLQQAEPNTVPQFNNDDRVGIIWNTGLTDSDRRMSNDLSAPFQSLRSIEYSMEESG